MNICYTLTAYPPSVGGAQLHFHSLARALSREHGVQVVAHWSRNRTDWLLGTTLLAPRDCTPYEHEGIAVRLLNLTMADRLKLLPYVAAYYPLKQLAIPGIARTLAEHLAAECGRPDLIHNGRIGREGLSYASRNLARRLGVPFVFTPFHHPRWVGWFYEPYIRLYREADAVIALTETERKTLIALGVPERRVHVTGMGAVLSSTYDAAAFRARHEIRGPMVLFLGQKYAYKNYRALLAAAPLVWQRWPETRFVFIGPRTKDSRQTFADYRDPRVLELGAVSAETKTSALAACDLLCVPSSQESFGGVFVEAWLMGKPVIGGEAPAVREVIADGQDGFLVSRDPAEIADRIAFLLGNPDTALRMAEAGRRKAEERYTWDRLAAKTLAVYEGVLRG